MGTFKVAGDDADATANVEYCVWVRDRSVDDAGISKGDEGEVLVVETGVICRARVEKQSAKGFRRHRVNRESIRPVNDELESLGRM